MGEQLSCTDPDGLTALGCEECPQIPRGTAAPSAESPFQPEPAGETSERIRGRSSPELKEREWMACRKDLLRRVRWCDQQKLGMGISGKGYATHGRENVEGQIEDGG